MQNNKDNNKFDYYRKKYYSCNLRAGNRIPDWIIDLRIELFGDVNKIKYNRQEISLLLGMPSNGYK